MNLRDIVTREAEKKEDCGLDLFDWRGYWGTNLRIGSYAEDAGLMDTISLSTRLAKGREIVVRDICDAVLGLTRREYGARQLAGVGLGAPGPLEFPEGILRNPPNLQGWDGFDLRNAIEGVLGCHVEIESDANVAALAEARLGAGRTHRVDSFCVLTLGAGVGNGLIFDGHIYGMVQPAWAEKLDTSS